MFSDAVPSEAAIAEAAPEDEAAGLLQDLGAGNATAKAPEDDRAADIFDALRHAADEQTADIEHICRFSLDFLSS